MPALQQIIHRHWWQAQSTSGQCPHYNKSTTVSDTDDKHSPRPANARTTTSQPVSDTDDKHSPRPANARTTTSQQQSQTLITSTVHVRPMPALQQVNHSHRHWSQAQSTSGQCPHYNKLTTVTDTDHKHSPRPANARTTTSQPVSDTDHKHSPRPANARTTTSQPVSDTDDKHSPRPANARTTTS